MKILMIGDIFGTEGRRAVAEQIKKLKQLHKIDFVIANAENTTHGRGLSKKHFEQLKKSGIDFFTFGNHT
jgi:calcineurin-like phosphoesterase